jgi:hypothetical protein
VRKLQSTMALEGSTGKMPPLWSNDLPGMAHSSCHSTSGGWSGYSGQSTASAPRMPQATAYPKKTVNIAGSRKRALKGLTPVRGNSYAGFSGECVDWQQSFGPVTAPTYPARRVSRDLSIFGSYLQFSSLLQGLLDMGRACVGWLG